MGVLDSAALAHTEIQHLLKAASNAAFVAQALYGYYS